MLRLVQDRLNSRNYYAFNPAFDTAWNGHGDHGRCDADAVQESCSAGNNPILDSANQITRTTVQTTQTTTQTSQQQARQFPSYNGKCGCTNFCTRYTNN